MKTILCYGDSNTWGSIPRTDNRYPKEIRWPGALGNLLGNGYEVISEGLCGRTFAAINPSKPHRTGITHLHAILESHDPLDLVIIMLGTNDIKTTYGLSAEEIAKDLEKTIELIRSDEVDISDLKILVICPPPVIEPSTKDLDPRMTNGAMLFKKLPSLFKDICNKHDCAFINAGDHVSSSLVDGYHLDESSHIKLAKVIAEKVITLI